MTTMTHPTTITTLEQAADYINGLALKLVEAQGLAADQRRTMDDLLGQIQELLQERDAATEEAEGLSAELEQAHEDYDTAQARIQDLEERLRWPRP
jgi:peptidoglycan hydrolase CwlO-like protein